MSGFTFKPNPHFQRDLEREVMRNIGKLRPTVQSVECPDHHQRPDLVQDGQGWQIVACCKRGAELAAAKAGIGDVTWRTG